MAQMDQKVEELESLEQEDDDSDDDYAESLRKELGEDMTKVKSTLASHTEFSNNIQLMCEYMMQTRSNVPQANKIIIELSNVVFVQFHNVIREFRVRS